MATHEPAPAESTVHDRPTQAVSWKHRIKSLARDFLLIVVGVLTALALENWNGSVKERRLESEYLEALAADVRSHIEHYDGWLEALARHTAWTDTIWTWSNGETPQKRPRDILLWLKLGGQVNLDTQFPDGAYQDLVNSGKLSLIGDRDVRQELINYHNGRIRWNAVLEANATRAIERYSTAVADLFPPEIGWRLATSTEIATVDLDPVLAEFRRRPSVRHGLVAMAESHRFRTDFAQRNRQRAVDLLQKLETAGAR